MRILIVEDQADIRDVLCEILSQAGHVITSTTNYHEAAALLAAPGAAGWCDLMVSDVVLPGGSGHDLAAQARSRGVRVLLCSGHPERLAELELLGVAHLRKPFTLRCLLVRVGDLLAAPAPTAATANARGRAGEDAASYTFESN